MFKDLCKRFEEALQIEQRAIQKATNQNRRSLTTNDSLPKVRSFIHLSTHVFRMNIHLLHF